MVFRSAQQPTTKCFLSPSLDRIAIASPNGLVVETSPRNCSILDAERPRHHPIHNHLCLYRRRFYFSFFRSGVFPFPNAAQLPPALTRWEFSFVPATCKECVEPKPAADVSPWCLPEFAREPTVGGALMLAFHHRAFGYLAGIVYASNYVPILQRRIYCCRIPSPINLWSSLTCGARPTRTRRAW